ncbi:MAG: hypothetical protein O9256_00890 [Rhizobiaceae bacterium]|nr:hypothetical protein [Rhizobiaceae bacterium]
MNSVPVFVSDLNGFKRLLSSFRAAKTRFPSNPKLNFSELRAAIAEALALARNDLIEEAGSEGATDIVRYIEQLLSAPDQSKARKIPRPELLRKNGKGRVLSDQDWRIRVLSDRVHELMSAVRTADEGVPFQREADTTAAGKHPHLIRPILITVPCGSCGAIASGKIQCFGSEIEYGASCSICGHQWATGDGRSCTCAACSAERKWLRAEIRSAISEINDEIKALNESPDLEYRESLRLREDRRGSKELQLELYRSFVDNANRLSRTLSKAIQFEPLSAKDFEELIGRAAASYGEKKKAIPVRDEAYKKGVLCKLPPVIKTVLF